MTTLFQDVRYALRVLWKSPGFTTVAVLSLALGVGVAIFSIVNAVLLRSLPFPHPERLVKIVANNRGVGAQDIGFSVPELDDLKSRAGIFEQVTAIQGGPTNLTGGERRNIPRNAGGESELIFPCSAPPPHWGVFDPGDETQGFAEAVVISDSLGPEGSAETPEFWGESCNSTTIPTPLSAFSRPGFAIQQNGGDGCRNMGDMWIQGRSLPETMIAACG